MSIVPIERPDPFDYRAFPRDARPWVLWGPEIPTRFTARSGVTSLAVVCISLVIALAVQLIAGWNVWAALVACVLGFLFAILFSSFAGMHYLSRLAADPRILREAKPVEVNGKQISLRSLRTRPFSRVDARLLALFVAIAVSCCAIAQQIERPYKVFGPIQGAWVVWAAFLVLLPVIHCPIHLLLNRNTSRLSIFLRHAIMVFCFWFEQDYRLEIPNAFRSPAGRFRVRILIFALPVLFLSLSLPWLCYYAPFVPNGFSERARSDLILSHPYSRANQIEPESVMKPGGDLTVNEILATNSQEQTSETVTPAMYHAVQEQRRIVTKEPLGWIQALPAFFWRHPLHGLYAVVVSFVCVMPLIVVAVGTVFVSFIASDAFIPHATACLDVASKHPYWDSLSLCLLASPDRHEQQSIYLGRIVE